MKGEGSSLINFKKWCNKINCIWGSRDSFKSKITPLGVSQATLKIIILIEFVYCLKFRPSSFCSSYINKAYSMYLLRYFKKKKTGEVLDLCESRHGRNFQNLQKNGVLKFFSEPRRPYSRCPRTHTGFLVNQNLSNLWYDWLKQLKISINNQF